MQTLSEKQLKNKLCRVWRGMNERCTYEKHKSYAFYGGRGIYVSDEWKTFEPFYHWAIANGYQPGLTIDRKDNDGPYAPGNCRWVTRKVNMNNTRFVKHVTKGDVTLNLSEWAALPTTPVSGVTISRRLNSGLDVTTAIDTPPFNERRIEAFGEVKSVVKWSEDCRCKISCALLRDRLMRGWNPEEAIATPKIDIAALVRIGNEIKSKAEWIRDSRCVVSSETFRTRLKRGWKPEDALLTPLKS